MELGTDDRGLQGCLNDLVTVMALPAMWTGRDAADVVRTLLDALVRMLPLAFACARLRPDGRGSDVDMVRLAVSPSTPGAERSVAQALAEWMAHDPERWPPLVPNPIGPGELTVVPLRLGLRENTGLIVVASSRTDFPRATDRVLLSVAANQAALQLQEARLLAEQRRIAQNLDAQVAERTQELAAANEELRRITDAIPQAITVLSPDGTIEYANAFVLAYVGLSLEEANSDAARARILHPDDLQRVRREHGAGLTRGAPFEIELRVRRKDGEYRWFLVRYRPLRRDSGEILRWYATGIDIEERRRMEERVRNENLALRDEIDRSSMFEEIVGSSAGLRRVLAQVAKVAPTDSTVLIVGETGTGKEIVARAIHKRSRRVNGPFIRVNCAVIPSALVASELFGHEKGAFTGALQRRIGRFEAADGGTIFLDEIGDLQPETQVALLRVLQEREFERVGSSRPVSVDVRVLAATNRDLAAAVKAGTFREDLFYRLNVFPIVIPPLRDRRDDVLLLVRYMIERYAKRAGKRIERIDGNALELFRAYAWPGNVRELQNVVERAVILSEGGTLAVDSSWLRCQASVPAPAGSLSGALAASERELTCGSLSGHDPLPLTVERCRLVASPRALEVGERRVVVAAPLGLEDPQALRVPDPRRRIRVCLFELHRRRLPDVVAHAFEPRVGSTADGGREPIDLACLGEEMEERAPPRPPRTHRQTPPGRGCSGRRARTAGGVKSAAHRGAPSRSPCHATSRRPTRPRTRSC